MGFDHRKMEAVEGQGTLRPPPEGATDAQVLQDAERLIGASNERADDRRRIHL